MSKIIFNDNLAELKKTQSSLIDLIYIDPPFNTGKVQKRVSLKTTQVDEGGDRIGFQGKQYATEVVGSTSYADSFEDYLGFLEPRLKEAYRVLKPNGSLFFHIDYREVHYCKILLDKIFGRECFQNEIIWAYDYGARSKTKWPAKHDSILWYTKDPKNYTFNFDAMDRIPYMSPGLVGPEKAAIGKTPTDVWWHTIVATNGKEKTGYATQKPLGVLDRIIKVHTNANDLVMDFFAGSGTTGEAAAKNGRQFLLVDCNLEAVNVMRVRLAEYAPDVELNLAPST
jgi:site-specific DNA-methyltransferase (adenine-specific)